MSFTKVSEWGDHKTYTYDKSKHKFLEYFQNLYNEKDISMLHLKSADYMSVKDYLSMGTLNDVDTDLHKVFYNDIKTDVVFKKLYCAFVQDLFAGLFPDEDIYMYQSYPSIRFQYLESKAVPPHKDSDNLSNHPLGELNFVIPITHMKNTNAIYVESVPNKKDFKSIELNYGEMFFFNGNTCTHYNEPNMEGKLRVSLDFRVILLSTYMEYISHNEIISSNPRDIFWKRPPKKMYCGGYYQISTKGESLDDMMKWYKNTQIVQHHPEFGKEEAEACYQYMLGDGYITEYHKTSELEGVISKYVGSKHCIMTTSGTSALILALMALDLEEGAEVIVPNYTMIATVNAVKVLKLTPVLVDVDPLTYTINTEIIEQAITEKTKCVIHVSLNNRYTVMTGIQELCDQKGIVLMEDSAQSLGCKINGKSLGTFGKVGCFSLSSPKIISTGQGGFLVTDDDNLAQKIRMIKNFGRKESGKDEFVTFGINLKYTDLQAVICLEQMKKLDERVQRMREIYNLYYTHLKGVKYGNVDIMQAPMSSEWIPWYVDICVDDREELVGYLKKHNISTRSVYGEINKSPIYFSKETLPNSHSICTRGLFLPSFVAITDVQILYICKMIKSFIRTQNIQSV